MSVYTHPFLPSFLHAILRVTKRRSVTQLLGTRLRLNKGRFSATRVSPTFGPSFFSVCSLRYCLHTGISWVSSLNCFICLQLVYLYPCDVHRRTYPLGCLWSRILRCYCHVLVVCWRSVCLFQLCVICRHNTLMFYLAPSLLAVTCQMSGRCHLFQLGVFLSA